MIHDYARNGIGTSPLQFAENYYLHYPKVAFGIWPPVFHSTAALWMLFFTRTHTSLLIFIAVQGGLCAATLACFARRLFPPVAAFLLGLFLVLLPAFQNATSLMMVDVFLTLMQLAAMLLLIAFFRTESMKTAIWFGIVTSLAMLTKGNANSLLMAAVFMLLLTRQFSIFKRAPVYVAGLIIAFLGLPWQVVSMRLYSGTIPVEPQSIARSWMLFTGYTAVFIQKLSLPLFVFAVAGLAACCIPLLLGRRDQPNRLDIAGAASLVLAIFIFHCIAPTPGPDDRYLLPALPLMLLFAALGIRWVASLIPVPRLSLGAKASLLTVLCLGWFGKTTFAFTHRPEMGFSKTANLLLPARVSDEVVLVCSDSWGEGALITAMALGDRRPDDHIILRGTKILSESPWVGDADYTPLFHSPAELEQYLESVPVDVIVLDLSKVRWAQDADLLTRTIRQNRDKWALVTEISESPESRHLQLYRWTGLDHSNMRKNIRLRMRQMLGHDIQSN